MPEEGLVSAVTFIGTELAKPSSGILRVAHRYPLGGFKILAVPGIHFKSPAVE